MGVMPASVAGGDHVLHGFQVVGAVLHIDEDIVEAGGGEGARDFRRPVDLQSAPENRLTPGQTLAGLVDVHVKLLLSCEI